MEVCSNFCPDHWRPEKCRKCFHLNEEHSKRTLISKPPPPTKPKPAMISETTTSSRTVEPNLDETLPVTYPSELMPTSTDQNTTDVSQKQSLVSDDSTIISPISNNEQPVPCSDGEKQLDNNSYLDGVQDQIDYSKNVMQSTDIALADLSVTDQNTASQQQEQQYPTCCADSDERGSDAAFTDQTVISPQQVRCSSVASNDTDTLASSNKQNSSSPKIPCMYGERCYRKSAEHLEKYSHPHQRQIHTGDPTKPTRSSSLSKKPCRYGEQCNRKNPEHLEKYFHPHKAPNPIDKQPIVKENLPRDFYLSTVAHIIATVETDIEAKRRQAEEELQRQKAEIEALRQKMEEELQQQATEMEHRRQKMEEELQRRQAEMDLGQRKTEEELQRQKAEIEVGRQKAEEGLQQQKVEMELGRQKAKEELQRQTAEMELRRQTLNEELQHQITHMEAEREQAQRHLELVEKQFRESMVGVQNEKKYLEESIEKLRQEKMKIATYHQQLEKALAQELNDRERREIEKQRILEIKRDVPSYWGINAFDQPYREIKISPGSSEFNILRDLLNDTIETHGDKFGTIYNKDPTEFLVTSITRIHNKKLWHEYCFKKESIIEKNENHLMNCESSKYLRDYPILAPLLDDRANEYWLFHGCDEKILPILAVTGYDPRVSSLDGMFGGGFYLAENSSKSNQYIPCPGCGKNAIFSGEGCRCKNQENLEFSIILYRAVLGDVHVAKQYDQKKYRIGDDKRRVRRPPYKENSYLLYDSVMGESVKYGADRLRYREFILYEPGQAYPEYIIKFRRAATNAHAPSDIGRVKDRCYYFLRNTVKLRRE